MTKTARLSFIASVCHKMRGTRTEVISALPSEIREETRLAKRHDDDEGILDEGIEVSIVSPALLSMVKVPTHARHANIDDCLTLAEHRQLAADLVEYRKTHVRQPSYSKRLWLAIIRPDPFETMKRVEPLEIAHV